METYMSVRQDETDASKVRARLGHALPQSSVPRKPVPNSVTGASSLESSSQPEKQPLHYSSNRAKPRRKPNLLKIWWPEICCCVLVIASLLAIVATIYPYHDRPLPQWPYRLTVNSLIALYVVFFKASMLLITAQGLSQLKWNWFRQDRSLRDLVHYDYASRGPLGCIKLLWMLRGRQLVTSCGALITIAALIIDPFAQQAIVPYACRSNVPDATAAIPKTNSWAEGGLHQTPGYGIAGFPMQRSVASGIFSPGQNVPYSCTTGNCTFSEYHTVGYCSSCYDATDELNFRKLNGASWNMTLPSHDFFGYNTTINVRVGNGSDGGYLTSDPNWPYMRFDSYSQSVNMIDNFDTDIVLAGTWSNVNAGPCPGHCQISSEITKSPECLKWGCPSYNTPTRFGTLESWVGAARCSLFPCVRTYNASIVNGQLFETLVEKRSDWGFLYNIGGLLFVPCLSFSDRDALVSAGYNFTPGQTWLPYGNDSVPTLISESATETCMYSYWDEASSALDNYLSTFLSGNITPSGYDSWGEYGGPVQLESLFDDSYVTFDALDQTWANISDAITLHIRQNGAVNYSDPAVGTAYMVQTCARAQWAFLIYPATLALLTLIFLGAMIAETKGSGKDWKSSPLALLFHGFDETIMNSAAQHGQLGLSGEMEDMAASLRVRLSEFGDNSRFVGAEDVKGESVAPSKEELGAWPQTKKEGAWTVQAIGPDELRSEEWGLDTVNRLRSL